MSSAYLLIAHGSREKESNQAFEKFTDELRRRFPERDVQPAYLELVKPDISEAIELCVSRGAEEIFVIPLMLFPGRHVKEHIPQFVQEAKKKHPHIDFHYAGPLSDQPLMIELVDQSISRKVKTR
ncbi:MAG: CbiX/SirB N-terminal domain-containing protein [Candidatus Omnitrophica bacterium]|nr:CbiX/SirB N-terminal domain-containing protein [Candidatus Omnitrophota bacterium]